MPGRVGTRQGEYFSQALCRVFSRALLPESRGFVPAVFRYLEAGAALAADPRAHVQPAAPQPCCSCCRAPQGSRNISTRCPVGTEPLAASELHLHGHLSLSGVGKPKHLATEQQPSWGCGWEGLLPPIPCQVGPAAGATMVPIGLSPNPPRCWQLPMEVAGVGERGSPAKLPAPRLLPAALPCPGAVLAHPPLWLLLLWPRRRFNFSNSLERVIFHNSARCGALCLPALPSPTCCWRAPAAHACTCPARPACPSLLHTQTSRLAPVLPPGAINPGTPKSHSATAAGAAWCMACLSSSPCSLRDSCALGSGVTPQTGGWFVTGGVCSVGSLGVQQQVASEWERWVHAGCITCTP